MNSKFVLICFALLCCPIIKAQQDISPIEDLINLVGTSLPPNLSERIRGEERVDIPGAGSIVLQSEKLGSETLSYAILLENNIFRAGYLCFSTTTEINGDQLDELDELEQEMYKYSLTRKFTKYQKTKNGALLKMGTKECGFNILAPTAVFFYITDGDVRLFEDLKHW